MNKQNSQAELARGKRALIDALRKLRHGDFSVRLPEQGSDTDVQIAMLFNEVVTLNQQITG